MTNEKARGGHFFGRPLPWGLISLLVLPFLLFWLVPQGSDRADLTGKAAPELRFTYYWGEKSSVSQLRGQVVLVNFWATWCQPCMAEMPDLRALEDALGPKGLVIVGIDVEESYDEVKKHLNLERCPRRLSFDYKATDIRPYRVSSIPVSFLIDRAGMIKKIYVGPRRWTHPEILSEIGELLAGSS